MQGLLIHEHIASAYGVTLSAEQHAQAHMRGVERCWTASPARTARPLPQSRPPGERVVGVCRHFTLLHVAMLRRPGHGGAGALRLRRLLREGQVHRPLGHGILERGRSSAGCWSTPSSTQRQRELFGIAFDPLDVPRDQFLVAGDAWQLCRGGKADPGAFGILDMHGLWFIASNVIRDVAALNNHEMLPWDVWGAMTQNDAELDLPFIDRLAELSHAPDSALRRAARRLQGQARRRARHGVQCRPQPSRPRP